MPTGSIVHINAISLIALEVENMRLSKEQFRNENLYETTMLYVKGMLNQGLITADEYRVIETKFRKRYHPIFDGLFCELDLISVQSRAIIGSDIN